MKLEKFEKWCEFASKGMTKYDWFIILISYILCALAYDLHLDVLLNVSGSIFLMLVFWHVLTLICLIVLECIKRHKSKKTNIEKMIDEEIKKGK